MNVDGKREFLANFWKRRDSTPETEVNEVKRDYFQRVDYANQVFSGSWNEGWRTDRGRVILLYGMPDEVDRNYMEIDKKPYEVWHYYNLEGGVIFIFADLSGFGNYELLHSTYSRELSNPNWENMISKTRQGNSGTDMWQN